jgi:YD repeat-containing protein
MVEMTDGGGTRYGYRYDGAGWLREVLWGDSLMSRVRYEYDGMGSIAPMHTTFAEKTTYVDAALLEVQRGGSIVAHEVAHRLRIASRLDAGEPGGADYKIGTVGRLDGKSVSDYSTSKGGTLRTLLLMALSESAFAGEVTPSSSESVRPTASAEFDCVRSGPHAVTVSLTASEDDISIVRAPGASRNRT